jgi:F-type H+-transporting ATPase subunit b
MELFYDPEFWVLIAFVIAIALVWRKATAGISQSLDARAARIKAELDEAQRLREEAQQALATYQRKQRDALKEAEAIVNHARAEAERFGEQARRDLEAAIERRRRQAEDKIAQAEAKAVAEVRAAAVDVAMAAARRIIGQSVDAARGARLIDDAIHALPQRLH